MRYLPYTGALTLLASHVSLAADPAIRPIALSAAQRADLVMLACSGTSASAGLEIHAWRVRLQNRNAIEATLLCPLKDAHEYPAYRQSRCTKEPDKAWVCAEGLDAFHFPMGPRKVLITYKAGTISADTAIEISTFVGVTFGYTFNGRNLRDMMLRAGQCHVDEKGASVIKGALNYSLNCGESGVVVTKDCTKRACRLFPALVYDNVTGKDVGH